MMDENEKKELKILGISIWKIFFYFIIYSFLGYVIETIFGIATKGVLESRQSFLYGPFCGIYGVGAVFIIVSSQYFNKNNLKLFLGGFIIGGVVEYLVSFLIEIILNTQWWDYSNYILNLNGRICLLYSIFWGTLALILVKIINPQIDKLYNIISKKISPKILNVIITIFIIFLFIDSIATCIAQNIFADRMIVQNNIEVKEKEEVLERYNKLYENETISKFVDKYWSDKKMIRTFPNIKIKDKDGNVVYLDSFLGDIQPYYIKIYNK